VVDQEPADLRDAGERDGQVGFDPGSGIRGPQG
jgi:hypothetical protein